MALLLSAMLVPVQPVPVEKGARFVIHVPYTIEHIHHHHKEKVFIPVVHHKKHPLEDNFKQWHHIVVEESDGHRGKPSHTEHEGFSVTPQKSHFEHLGGGFSVTPQMNQASLVDSGYSITPEKTQGDSADSGFEITPEETHAGLEDSGFNLTPEISQENLADSEYSINSQKTEAASTDAGLSLTPQKWPTLTGLSHRNPFSGRHFGRSLGAQPPMYNPHSINIASQTSVGGDVKDEDSGYKTKEEVEDVTTPAPPGFKPQAVTNIQTYQQSSGDTESQELLQQIQPSDYEPSLQLQYQASFQPQANLEPQANVELPVNPIGVSYIPGQVMSYQIMDHQGNAFNRLTLHNKREAKYKLHTPVIDSKSKGQRVRVPIRTHLTSGLMRLPHSGEGYRIQHPGIPHKNLMRVPDGIKPEKVSQGQVQSGYDALTSESKPVAQIRTQNGKVLFKIEAKRGIPEKTPTRQREPGRISGTKVEVPVPSKIVQSTVVKVRVPVRVLAAYKEPRRIPSDKPVSGIKPHTHISPQTDRLVPKVESKIKSQETAMSANVGVSSGRKEQEMTSNGFESATSESNTGFEKNSQVGKVVFRVQNPQETTATVPESKSVTPLTKEYQTASKEKDKITDQQREMSASPKGSSEEGSQVFYPSIGPFGNSESPDVSLGHRKETASSKETDKEADKKTSVITQTT